MKSKSLLFVCLLLPFFLFANAGSPMMWFGIFHILFLNLIIAFTESYFLVKMRIQNKIGIIILANYVSMIIGYNFIAPYFSNISGNHDFWGGKTNYGEYEIYGFLIGMFTSYIATLIIEFPFFYYAVKDRTLKNKLFFPFLLSNTITNLIMFFCYYYIATD